MCSCSPKTKLGTQILFHLRMTNQSPRARFQNVQVGKYNKQLWNVSTEFTRLEDLGRHNFCQPFAHAWNLLSTILMNCTNIWTPGCLCICMYCDEC